MDTKDSNPDAALATETDRIIKIIIELSTNLATDNSKQCIRKAANGACEILKTIELWLSTALNDANNNICQCPVCDETRYNLNKAMDSIKDSIEQAQNPAANSALAASFSLGSCAAQIVLLPTMVVIMGNMIRHAHNMVTDVIDGKVVELSFDEQSCSHCGACNKTTGDDPNKKSN